MTTADLIASLVAGFLLLIVGIFLIVKIRATRPASLEAAPEGELESEFETPDQFVEAADFGDDDAEIRLESDEETDLVLSSLENLEFRVDADVAEEEAPLKEVVATEFPEAEEILTTAPDLEIETEEAIEAEIETPADLETRIEADAEVEAKAPVESTSPFEWVAAEEEDAAEQAIEAPAAVEEASEVLQSSEIDEIVPAAATEADTAPLASEATLEPEAETRVSETEGTEEIALAEIEAEADQIHAEIESLTENDEDLRRATLRPAPKRNRRNSEVNANLDSQISELDHRLDALEALVSSIEESLAEFEPLLEEEENAPAHRTAQSNEDQAAAA